MGFFDRMLGKKTTLRRGNSEGTMYRADLSRTGFYPGTAPRTLRGVRWEVRCGDNFKSSPVTADGMVFVLPDDGVLHAIEATTGKVKWKTPTGDRWGIGDSSPAVADGLVYVENSKFLYAIKVASGKVAWKFETTNGGSSSPAVCRDRVLFGCMDRVYAVDAATGKEAWHHDVKGLLKVPAVEADGGFVHWIANDVIISLDIDSGALVCRIETPFESHRIVEPGIRQGRVLVGAREHSETLLVDARAGRAASAGFGYLTSGFAIGPDRLFATLESQLLAAWEASPDSKEFRRLWTLKDPFGGFYHTAPSATSDTVLVGCDRGVCAVDAVSGVELWKHSTSSTVISPPAIDDGSVFVTTYGGVALALY